MNIPRGQRLRITANLVRLGLAGSLLWLPLSISDRADAGLTAPTAAGAIGKARAIPARIENYDIRNDKSEKATRTIISLRDPAGRNSDQRAAERQKFRAGEAALRQRVPQLKIDYSPDLGAPEVIGVDVNQPGSLSESSGRGPGQKHSGQVRQFITQNRDLFGLTGGQIDQLVTRADYTNPDGNLSYVELDQSINGIPVFRGEIRAQITRDGAIARLVSNLAPGLEYTSLPTDSGSPEDAVSAAVRAIYRNAAPEDLQVLSRGRNGKIVTINSGQFAAPTTAELIYFPLEPGLATLAWRISLWEPVASYYVIVDARTGALLWRKNTTQDQSQNATYGVYEAESPGPLSPTNAVPGSGIQGPGIPRSVLTLIGNEAPNPGLNNLGWIPDGSNVTDGNNVEAGPDLVAPNGVDAPVAGSPFRVFNFAYNPPPLGADDPTGAEYRKGSATNVFYWTNIYHDRLYGAGFTEAARNFQNDNFGRGGLAGDRISAETPDSGGTNTASMAVQADGVRGRLQLSVFTASTPNRDPGLDAEVFLHELTHGTSGRLVGNATGLGSLRAAALGEGWSDFYPRILVSTADEDINGVYPLAGYVSLNFATLGTDNYYYGIRRFPFAVKTTSGGPNNRPHNPLTFADVDPAQFNISDGAYPPAPWIGGGAGEAHNAGEVWCMMLVEVRARLINRLGFAAGNQRMLQLTTDAMKIGPLNPNFVSGRDAIIAADQAGYGGADVQDIWAGFATRGLGFGAADFGTAVTESFNLPNLTIGNPFSVSDAPGDGDGYPEPGENVLLNVAVTNTTGNTYTNVIASAIGGGSANYGTINNNQTVIRQIPYLIPAGDPCAFIHTVSLSVISAENQVPAITQKSFRLGSPAGGGPFTFSNASAITINDSTGMPAASMPYGNSVTVSGLTGNKKLKVGFTGFSHSFPGDVDVLLVGPGGQKMVIMSDVVGTSDAVNVNFSLIDSAALLLPPSSPLVDFNEYRPSDVTAGDTFPAPAPAGPYQSAIPVGSATLASTFGTQGSTLNGTWTLYVVDDAGQDAGSIAGGWYLTFEGDDYICVVDPHRGNRADFDGDGKSDVSVIRGGGTWYLNRSTAGFAAINFGTSGDVAAPGDYDGDGKTDEAVVRSGNQWYLLRSTAGFTGVTFGAGGDLPMAADYDGDGKTDVAVYRPSTNAWYALRSSDGSLFSIFWGQTGDVPVVADFDGDGRADPTVFRPGIGTWFTLKSTGGMNTVGWGLSGDVLASADYDGDHRDDYAVFRNGSWYILKSAGGTTSVGWGTTGDVPVPGDYDGDGKYDVAVFRLGAWYVLGSAGGVTSQGFGLAGDVAVPVRYIQ
ncbi:MAG: M36 family metallopeptidase [Pyrinomonadaceae bacterium]